MFVSGFANCVGNKILIVRCAVASVLFQFHCLVVVDSDSVKIPRFKLETAPPSRLAIATLVFGLGVDQVLRRIALALAILI